MVPVVLTLCYANPRCLSETYRRYHATTSARAIGAHHLLVDQHYPLDYPLVRSTIEALAANLPRAHLLDPGRNLGLHEGLNWACRQVPLGDDDVIVGLDGDELLETPGWLDAMMAMFRADPRLGWVSLGSPNVDDEAVARGPMRSPIVELAGYRAYEFVEPMINHVCGFRWRAVRSAGGFWENRPYYGGLESDLMPRFKGAGYRVLHMLDHRVARVDALRLQDDAYQDYKRAHTSERDRFDGSFDEWLRARGAGPTLR